MMSPKHRNVSASAIHPTITTYELTWEFYGLKITWQFIWIKMLATSKAKYDFTSYTTSAVDFMAFYKQKIKLEKLLLWQTVIACLLHALAETDFRQHFYCAMHISAKRGLAIAYRPSVTLVDCDHIGGKSWKLTARTISPTPSLFVARRRSTYSQGNMEKFGGD